jgi:hypothetical protein
MSSISGLVSDHDTPIGKPEYCCFGLQQCGVKILGQVRVLEDIVPVPTNYPRISCRLWRERRKLVFRWLVWASRGVS